MAVHESRRSILSLKSCLFTPATKADQFGRAAEVHADALIIDLEDAVALSDKQEARAAALQYVEQPAEGKGRLVDLLSNDPEFPQIFDRTAIERLIEPTNYLGNSGAMVGERRVKCCSIRF